jgi:hypothetical protein
MIREGIIYFCIFGEKLSLTMDKTVPETDPYKKVCKYKFCKKTFDAKRTNQDYCCPDHRTKANNVLARQEREVSNPIFRQMKKNRRILAQLHSRGNYTETARNLEFMGFNIDVHSQRLIIDSKPVFDFLDYRITVQNPQHLTISKI